MAIEYPDIRAFVQHLAPTWGKHQHENFAQLVRALLQRASLNLSNLARAMPRSSQPLHGRVKRLDRFLDNPRIDEAALFVRWLDLSYRFGEDLPPASDGRPILPLLLDTVYFEPFAMLVTTVPCGSRGLPIALTTYHRTTLQACFPPKSAWPPLLQDPRPPCRRKGKRPTPACAVVTAFDSQNKIEERLIEYVFFLLSPALLGVIVADRGFARASLFWYLLAHKRAFAIRIDGETHIRLPKPLTPDRPDQGPPGQVLGIRPGQRIWCAQAWYGKEEQVPVSLLAVWDVGQKEPWYIATSLQTAQQTETVYRWRMRLELANRDEKTGVILREGGDQHALMSVMHVHRLLLALCTAEWLCALVGLQAWHDLDAPQGADRAAETPPRALSAPITPSLAEPTVPSLPQAASPSTPAPAKSAGSWIPEWASDPAILREGPAMPPAIIPHRGQTPQLPRWMRRFTARGWLSYVRLGLEVLRSGDLGQIVRRMVRWLASYLWPWTPRWRAWQVRYRMRHWWIDSS
ncbi:MAG TPA: hypothetical protein VI729_08875 [Anaerolineales bacterium]|nr:hypothetical protein [Anaerolineales bacterium]